MIIRASSHPILLLLAVAAGPALGQSADSFEAVSIKLSGPQSQRAQSGGPVSIDPGQFSFTRATLLDLIGIAYRVQPFQISSRTALEQEHYDLIAKLPGGTGVDDFRAMMRNMLAERFNLKIHIEHKEYPAYELRVARGGLKLKESTGGGDSTPEGSPADRFPPQPPSGGIATAYSVVDGYVVVRMRGREATLFNIARWLSIPNEPPVVDRTGLSGKYDFTLEFTHELPGTPPDASAQLPTIRCV